MDPNYTLVKLDESTGYISIDVNTPSDECVDLLRTIPSRKYQYSSKLSIIKVSDLQLFYSKCNANEFIIASTPEIDEEVKQFLNKPDYSLTYDGRRGRILFNRRDTFSPHFHAFTIFSTWTFEHNGYSVSISEVYKLPKLYQAYPKITFKATEEVNKIIEDEVKKRAEVLELITATDAPEIEDDISLSLRPFQRVAKKFALHTKSRAILALDMGLGKTPTSISIAEADPTVKKVLIICPATLKTNWRREILKSTGLECNVLSGASPNQIAINSLLLSPKKYHIINYDILGRGERDKEAKVFVSPWAKILNIAQFDMIIFDEAHYTKNMDSGRSKAARELKSRQVLALTGTPIVNRPSELFPILHILDPKTFPSFDSFVSQWLFDSGKTVRNPEAFREMLSSYMFRRKKEEVIKDLPVIERFDHFFELSPIARALYEKIKEGIYISLRNPNFIREVNSILAEIQRLKQVVADDSVAHTVQKAQEIYEESEKKILIFSQFLNSCRDIAAQLGPEALCITGEDSDESRYKKIDLFQNDTENKYKYMVLSTKAGAEGITLTAAHYIIFNDLCWTPKDHRQAEARCYGRMNDMHGAIAYYVQAEDTIIQTIMDILRTKMALIESTIESVNTHAEEGQSIVTDFLNQLRLGM